MEANSDRVLLERIARQLYQWAEESQRGGWSTHQVDPQRRLADQISRHIATAPAKPLTVDAPPHPLGCRCETCRAIR